MSEERSESRRRVPPILWLVVALPVLLVLPLGIAAGEHCIRGSDHFEDLLRRVGVHDTRDRVYRPVIDLFQ